MRCFQAFLLAESKRKKYEKLCLDAVKYKTIKIVTHIEPALGKGRAKTK